MLIYTILVPDGVDTVAHTGVDQSEQTTVGLTRKYMGEG